MSDKQVKTTKITITETRSTGMSSVAWGANLDAVGFNLTLLDGMNPAIASRIRSLYEEAQGLPLASQS